MDMDILEFKGSYRWLSNFWLSPIVYEGINYPSVENAYQAAKTFPSNREKFENCSPSKAKILSKKIKIRCDFDILKKDIMRTLIQQKFAPGTELGEKLKNTGTGLIVEGNNWGDKYWGVCDGEGLNILGKLIMEQRDLLQHSNKEKKVF